MKDIYQKSSLYVGKMIIVTLENGIKNFYENEIEYIFEKTEFYQIDDIIYRKENFPPKWYSLLDAADSPFSIIEKYLEIFTESYAILESDFNLYKANITYIRNIKPLWQYEKQKNYYVPEYAKNQIDKFELLQLYNEINDSTKSKWQKIKSDSLINKKIV